jgi:hypothetical protein
MSPDLATPPINSHAEAAKALLVDAWDALTADAEPDTASASAKAAMAQAHAALALAQDTRAAAYDARTNSLIAYFATLNAGTHADAQHAAVIDALIRDRLNFTPSNEGDPTP